MLILAGTFAYSFNAIGIILQEMNLNENILKLKQLLLFNYLRT